MFTCIARKLFLLIFLFSTIYSSNPLNISLNKTRNLAGLIELDFIEAKNLIFNTDSRWQFKVEYNSVSELTLESVYSISILYKGALKTASCQVEADYKLNCFLNEEGQTLFDLIQLTHELNSQATIKWTNLNKIYNIAIDASLKYEDSYSLAFHTGLNFNYWDFRVKIKEKVLPENGIVKLDLSFTSTDKEVAQCSHKNYYLYCAFNRTRPSSYIFKISTVKDQGSIEWEDLEEDVQIPLAYTARTFGQPYNLDYINNQWNYILKTTGSTLGDTSSLITINTKIINKAGNEYIYLTRCYSLHTITDDKEFQCTVFGENQKPGDLVYVTKSTNNDISVDWGTALRQEDTAIIRNAELSFVNIYDLEYIERNWNFKIKVSNDENLPENSVVYVDIFHLINRGNIMSTCSFNNHVLNCTKLSSASSSTYLIRFQSEKNKGSVTWNNLKQKYIPIPLNYKLSLTRANNALFTDKWNFLILATYKGDAPNYSKIVIDITQNNVETTASCELLKQGSNGLSYYIFCFSELEEQTINDIITISSTKKQGSVTWTNEINESNNRVEKIVTSSSNIKSIELDFIDAYDLNFANGKWFFTIMSRSLNTNINGVLGVYKVDIFVKTTSSEFNSVALCLLYDGIETNTHIRFLCYCYYANQNKEDLIKILYPKTSSSTVTWLHGIEDMVQISLITKLTIKKADTLTKNADTYWTFNIETENSENTLLPLNSKVIVDMSISEYLANCTAVDSNKLSCVSNVRGSEEPKLAYLKTLDSSVTWTNENEEDYYIIRTADLSILSVDYLYFKNNKWHFNISTSSLYAAKVIVDILYNNNPSTATCYGGKNNLISCTVDNPTQEKTALIKLRKDKSTESTITWLNLNEDKDISLWTELTFKKAGNLHVETVGTDKKVWKFDVNIKESDIPQGGYIVADIQLYHYTGGDEKYAKRINSIAKCYHNNKKLTCEVVIDRTLNRPYEYYTSLVRNKNIKSIGSVITWKEMPNEIMPISLTASLEYFYSNEIIKENNQNIFYIELTQSTKVPKESFCVIDIIIDTENKLGNCFAQNHTTLRCEIDVNVDISDNKIYIAKDKSELSTITWSNLNINQNLFSMRLTFIYAYDFSYIAYTNAYFKIIALGQDLKNGLIIPVKLNQERNAKIGSILYEKLQDISCECSNSVLSCHWFNSRGIYPDKDKYYLSLKETGDTIKWTNPGLYDIVESRFFNLHYGDIIYCYYDENNNYYKYSLALTQNADNTDFFIIDLIINGENSFGACTKKDETTLECFTSVMTRNNNDNIVINKDKIKGNAIWVSLGENKEIYPKDYIFAVVDKIYDLEYNTDKYEFNIKCNFISNFVGSKQIDILVGSTESTANCEVIDTSENILKCSTGPLSQNDLITFNKNWISNEHLFLYNIKQNGIPLKVNLELVTAYSLKYEQNWSFKLKTKISSESMIIPSGSTISIDIKYDNNNELALCTENDRNENEINLLCIPQNEINKNSLIKLSNAAKSDYSSVTWSSFILDENTFIYVDLELNVDYVTIPEFDSTNSEWKFQMIFINDISYPLNSKSKIDLKYNDDEGALANCYLIEQYKFECTPDISAQNENDKFSIIFNKNKGSITFINSPERLEFILSLFYIKVNNFKLEDKITFDIELSKSNMKEGTIIAIDLLVDGFNNKTNCKNVANILKCELEYDEQNQPNNIKLINDVNNKDFRWYNIPDEVELYKSNIIIEYTTENFDSTDFSLISTKEIKEIKETEEIIKIVTVYGIYHISQTRILLLEERESDQIGNKILDKVRTLLTKGEIDSSLLKSGDYFIVEYSNIRFIIADSALKDSNIPSINFNECTSKLKESKGIPEEENLYVLYIEVSEPEMNIPKLEYEIYSLSDENKYDKFNLDICKDVKVEITVSVNISQSDIDKYNSSSGYYNDICYITTSEQGTDITLKDRRDEYINNNLAVCEDECVFSSYDVNTGKAICSCPMSLSVSDISDIKIDKNKLKKNFIDIKNIINIDILKCYDLLFSDYLSKNSGCLVIIAIFVLGIFSGLLFYCHYYNIFNNQVKDILYIKQAEIKPQNKNININNEETPKETKPSRQLPEEEINNIKYENNYNAPPKKEILESYPSEDNFNKNEKNKISVLKVNDNSHTSKQLEEKVTPNIYYSSKSDFNDSEINLLPYKEALIIDDRLYCQYYSSLIRTKHLLVFSFCSTKDYNSRLVKINLFFFNFAASLFVNSLFFNDSTMHKIYVDGGGFNLEYHLAQIIYSTIISSILITIVKITALTESNVLEIKSAKPKELDKIYKKETKSIKLKFISFFIIFFILLLFFGFYVGCFCAVYRNTQEQLLDDTLISFFISLLYPLIIYFIPGFFRIPALKDEKQDSEYKYKFSKLIQFIV